jgi:hypothetical protein
MKKLKKKLTLSSNCEVGNSLWKTIMFQSKFDLIMFQFKNLVSKMFCSHDKEFGERNLGKRFV